MYGSVDFDHLFKRFEDLKIGVVGDVMLDTYLWGNVERISPEAPVPVVSLTKKDFRLGGAANVSLNLKALGASVHVFSVTGEDDDSTILFSGFKKESIGTDGLLKSRNRITTNKSRIISRNQQMLRLDAEITEDIDNEDEGRLLESVERFVSEEKPQAIILEDYNKGVLTANVIREVIRICRKNDVITSVDPKKKNFFEYKKASIFKPNLKEVREALNLEGKPELRELNHIHSLLKKQLNHEISLITLSERGVFFEQGDVSAIVPSHVRNIADVSGAGDTVIAVASLAYAATQDLKLAAEIANIAGGLVCEEVGTVAINSARLLEECKALLAG